MSVIKSCSDCRFFVPGQRVSTETHDGTCHNMPPGNYSTPLPADPDQDAAAVDDGTVELVTIYDTTYTGWPIVRGSDWCGSWEAL